MLQIPNKINPFPPGFVPPPLPWLAQEEADRVAAASAVEAAATTLDDKAEVQEAAFVADGEIPL